MSADPIIRCEWIFENVIKARKVVVWKLPVQQKLSHKTRTDLNQTFALILFDLGSLSKLKPVCTSGVSVKLYVRIRVSATPTNETERNTRVYENKSNETKRNGDTLMWGFMALTMTLPEHYIYIERERQTERERELIYMCVWEREIECALVV